MNILGIETSCDETAAALVRNGRKVLSNVVASQVAIHERFLGVVPELASRAHVENINLVVGSALREAGIRREDFSRHITAVAYTRGPGLAGALLVGQIAAQTLAAVHRIPLVDVNHLEGHIYAALLEHGGLKPPYLSLIVSGGHTELVIVNAFGEYRFLGGTRDDAAGEAFDKVAKLLKLGYPGGPVIDALSKKGNRNAVRFPRPLLKGTWEFSFSGLKTAVVNAVMKHEVGTVYRVEDICASFQQAVIDTLVEKTFAAAREYGMRTIVVGGGVAANTGLRDELHKRGKKEKMKVYLPSLRFCTDNAAMIACAGYYRFRQAPPACEAWNRVQRIEPNLKLFDWSLAGAHSG